jgi:hypothetical protein
MNAENAPLFRKAAGLEHQLSSQLFSINNSRIEKSLASTAKGILLFVNGSCNMVS